MSTIDPSTIDPTKPAQGEALTANVRANEQATQDNFTAAKVDIEALETGKADDSALQAHIGTGGVAQHPSATTGLSGFMSNTDKSNVDQNTTHRGLTNNPHGVNATQAGAAPDTHVDDSTHVPTGGAIDEVLVKLSSAPHDTGWAPQTGTGAGGTLHLVKRNGTTISTDRAGLNLIEGPNVVLSLADNAPSDQADVTIEATIPGGGGGDMISPVLSVTAGELYKSETTSGVQTLGTGLVSGLSGVLDFPGQTGPAHVPGRLYYDSNRNALSYYNDEAEISVQIGQEGLLRVWNGSGATISNGMVCRPDGAQNGLQRVVPALATTLVGSRVVGIATHAIENNSAGYLAAFGEIGSLNTASFAAGSLLYLSDTVPGGWTDAVPATYPIVVGLVTVSHASTGVIVAESVNPFADAPTDGSSYVRRGSDGSWQPGYTAAEQDAAFALQATTLTAGTGLSGGGDLSTGRTFDVNTSTDGGVAVVLDQVVLDFSVAAVTPAAGDHVLISDVSDSDNVRKVDVGDLLAGAGDVVQAGAGVTGDIATWENWAGKTAQGSFPAADVARLSQANTFTGGVQWIENAAGTASLVVNDTSLAATASTTLIGGQSLIDLRSSTNLGGGDPTNFLVTLRADGVASAELVQRDVGTQAVITTYLDLAKAGGVAVGTPTGGAPSTPGHLNAAELLINNAALGTLYEGAGNLDAHKISGDHDARYLQAVNQDAAPVLGGPLQTKGNEIILTRADDSEHGRVAPLTAIDGAALFYSTDGTFDTHDGAYVARQGIAEVYGSQLYVNNLKHLTDGGQDVKVSETGALYAVDPPPAGWSDVKLDSGIYPLGTGIGTGTWVAITGLMHTIGVGNAVSIGDVLNVSYSVYAINLSARVGDIDIGWGINGADPITENLRSHTIPDFFSGYLASGFQTATVALAEGDTITVFARRNNGSHSQYQPIIDHNSNTGESVLSATGTGGGTGDVVQSGPGADGEVTTWLSYGSKTVQGTGYLASNVARKDVGNTYVAGASQTALPVDSSTGPFAFDPLTINVVTFTGTSNVTIDPMGNDGEILLDFAGAGNVTPNGLTEIGMEPATSRRIATLWRPTAALGTFLMWGPDA